jgi:hypothetical protein
VLSRYAKLLLLAPTTGSLLICSLGLVVGTVALSRLTIRTDNRGALPHGSVPVMQSLHRMAAESSTLPRKSHHTLKVSFREDLQPVKTIGDIPGSVFHGLIADEDREMLQQYVHAPVSEVVRSARFHAFVDSVVPYTPFHYGVDMPLTRVLEKLLSRSEENVDLRSNRYLMLSNMSGRGMSRAFLWVDLVDGPVLGGIYFHPSNGEPTPTLTLFSRQVTDPNIHPSQLPTAFLQDLNQWISKSGVQAISTRYFVNAANQKSVLWHEENYCSSSMSETPTVDEACSQANEEAKNIDSNASNFLNQTRNASNATERMIAANSQNK